MPLLVGWILNLAYGLLLLAVSPFLIYRRIRFGKYRGGWREKLTGQLVRKYPERRCLWFHAVSVGEVLQLQKILDEAAERFPDSELFVTTTTDTGYDVARQKYPQHTVAYFPLDFSWAVATALDLIQPSLVVLVELELWPNFIFACRRRQIPLALINGRIGEKSFRGYRKLGPLIRRVLGSFDVLAVQNETYQQRLRDLGATADRITVTGNIKFDRVETNCKNARTMELRRSFGIGPEESVFIAGSTQAPEESYALDAWSDLNRQFPQLRLILVPRHKERFEEVAELVRQRGLPLVRRSHSGGRGWTSEATEAPGFRQSPPTPATHDLDSGEALSANHSQGLLPIVLLDTLGELAACWGLADVAFVGGSLTNRGGQNMIEPAGYGAAILFGPNTWNFKDITESLLSRQAARVVRGPQELTECLLELLNQPNLAQAMCESSRQFVTAQQGATSRTMDRIATLVAGSVESGNSRAA